MMEKVMRVAVRIRPLLPAELRLNREIRANVAADSRQVTLAGGHAFPCDFAFGPTVSQERIYCSSVKPLVSSLFSGRDLTVLAYGQAGSGKTYTLSGKHNDRAGDRGVVWRVCEDIFHEMTAKEHSSLILSACCVALCGDELRDLLSPDAKQKNLRITEDQNGRTVVSGAVEIPLGSMKDLQNVFKCMSDMNHQHSSSHTLLWLQLKQCGTSSQDALLSTLLVVDLAGWECVSGLVNADPSRFKRSLQISTELRPLVDMLQQDRLTLSSPESHVHTSQALSSHAHKPHTLLTQLDGSDLPKVYTHTSCPLVHSVSAQTHTHSPLVRLLQNSLSGSAQTLLLVCVSPAQSSLTDTASCLMLATRAQDKYSHADLKGEHTRQRSVLGAQGCLMQHAAALLEELQEYSLSPCLQQRLSTWLDAYKKTPHASSASHHKSGTFDVHQLPGTTTDNCDEIDASLIADAHSCEQSLQELKLHCRLQSELLVEQKLLADGLKRDQRTSEGGGQRLQSSPQTGRLPAHLNDPPACSGMAGNRRVRSSPCNLSLERLSATIKTSNQLLLARLEEQEQVPRLPSVRRTKETEGRVEAQNKDKKRSARPLLNRTWTRKHSPDLSSSTPDSQGTPGPRGACEGQGSVSESRSIGVSALLLEKERLQKRRDDLSGHLAEGSMGNEQGDGTLHQLEETIEAVDAVIGMRLHPDQQGATVRRLSDGSAPIASLRGLEDLSLQEAKALFYMYLGKAVCLRGRSASQQRRVCELEELLASEREQSSRRLQQLEKEVFFYRSSSRELRRRLKELVQDAPSPPSSQASCLRGSGDGGHGQGGALD
ncbi:hypothetical protein ACEWY4_012385 [Coilia grayii]|uniref:Kinesin motor domain-containing protein n=1 Tax=Coilia grayii TaxID=363190 RepID=A0ABD1K0D5_9TELE